MNIDASLIGKEPLNLSSSTAGNSVNPIPLLYSRNADPVIDLKLSEQEHLLKQRNDFLKNRQSFERHLFTHEHKAFSTLNSLSSHLNFRSQPSTNSPPISPQSLESLNPHVSKPSIRKNSLPRQNSFDQATANGKLSSSQIRQKLKECVLNKKNREMSKSPPSWTSPQNSFDSHDSSPAAHIAPVNNNARNQALPGSTISLLQDDFPLRKTSSEPNLKVKSALKQKVIERRSSPLLKRKLKAALIEKQMNQIALNGSTSANSSTDETPPNSINIMTTMPNDPGTLATTLPPYLSCPPSLLPAYTQEALSYFTSLPNLCFPPGVLPFVPNNSPALSNDHLCPPVSVTSNTTHVSVNNCVIRDSVPSDNATINTTSRRNIPKRRLARPLSRTHSAPLPIGVNATLQQAVQEQKLLVKAHLRQKVLNRSTESNISKSAASQSAWSKLTVNVNSDHSPAPHHLNSSSSLASSALSFPKFIDRLSCPSSLERTNSSPVMKVPSPIQEEKLLEFTYTTALAYDSGMLAHQCLCGEMNAHPENPNRLIAIWQRLQDTKLSSRCYKMPGKKATMDDLQLCHQDTYTVLYGTNPANRVKINHQLLMSVNFCRLACSGIGIDTDTVWNCANTANAARLAAGCVTELVLRVIQKDFLNGFAIVRPPGHHAEIQQAMGFCYFNSVAIAAKKALLHHPDVCKKILILDWDVHHGNGTQQIFYSDSSVLYISLHRYDGGAFFPGTGSIEECGEGDGHGYNINIAWGSARPMSDAEYIAAFRCIVIPVAREFQPDLVLVSAGFDAAAGHSQSLGGYNVSPACFAWMTQQVCQLAEGKIVMALEGGYELESLCDSVEACIRVLLQFNENFTENTCFDDINEVAIPEISQEERHRRPSEVAVTTLLQVAGTHSKVWKCLGDLNANFINLSMDEAAYPEETHTVAAMAELSFNNSSQLNEPMEAEEGT